MVNLPFSWVNFGPKDSTRRLVAGLAAIVLFIFLAIAIGTLARQALQQMRLLNTANSDNLQWTLSQTEVEYLQFHIALLQVQAGQTADLDDLRRWFDIFVSRMNIITQGPIYGHLVTEPQMAQEFAAVADFIDDVLPQIDGADLALRAQIPKIAARAQELRKDVRNITLEGIRVFSKMSDSQRHTVSETMGRIALLTVGLILILLMTVFFLAKIYRAAKVQSAENSATRERLQAMLNTALDAVLVVDRAGRLLAFNGAATEIFGYTEAEAIGKKMTDLVLAQDQQKPPLQVNLGAGDLGRLQVNAKRKSGEVFPVEWSRAKTMSPEGEIIVSYVRDISDRIRAEERLTKARDDALAGERAKARFMAVMSHEMRTPLNGLLGSLDLLKATKLTPKQVEFTNVMEKSGAMLLHHVNDVLDISRLESGRIIGDFVPLDLDVLIREVLESQKALAQAKKLRLRYRPEAGAIGSIMGSAIGLRQVLLNLVSNAIKFTDRGLVEVQTSLAIMDGHQRLSLRVRDTGMGIAPGDQARIFDDFVTLDSSFGRRADGTGLGLGIARRIVQSMGGAIGLVSEANLGSTFWIDLPYEKAAKPTLTPRPRKTQAENHMKQPGGSAYVKAAKLDILIVEDNQINRFILREMLIDMGHSVTEASDGLMGVDLAQSRRFDLIFMDISMPALDGIAATLRLRAGRGLSASAPIVALTAHALPDDHALFLASGMNAVLNKPLERAALFRVFEELLMWPKSPSKTSPKPSKSARISGPTKAMAAPPQEDLPILRAGALQELAQVLGPDRLPQMIDRFLQEGHRTLPASLKALAQGHDSQAKDMIHSLAGAAATFGALALQAQLAQMETELKRSNPAGARTMHPDLAKIWAQTAEAMAGI